ncbi:MAG: cyclic nucleotide-binding domain-containing protein [Candidatus Omnitrophica bacterium]|nr:cyclic nucleotide-binding domain-containing protein [Candidatus Omnitrophota bacterium]MCA9447644.1 cyclic nucleotide-binding domain-containing protein [Candidatus Omnitrophota bacterium]MCB9770247.1 cyclic nucleotide-binding domain-containing protein [Candidatus Omnitrophota bacterium]MCB9781764.1 cyclic nucleotide-binding domain-containing protein [Candidatus Omnitrophota bacterium]
METLNEFLSELPVRKLQPGEVLMHQGGTDKQVFLLKNGAVEVLKDGVSITEVSEELAVFGEMAILLNKNHTATVRAATESEFYVVEDAKKVLTWHPEAAMYVAEILARRLDSLNRYLVDVKSQFRQFDDHVNMVDEVLDTLMTKHPRNVERRSFEEQ